MNKNTLVSPRHALPTIVLAVSLAISATAPTLRAVDGSWATDIAGNWSDTTKWTGGIVADGIDGTANFNLDIAAARVVTLDTPRTIGNLVFTDTTTPFVTWNLAGTAANPLTFSTTTGTSTITSNSSVNFGNQFVISGVVTGSNNLVFNATTATAGARYMQVNNVLNNYTGTTTIQNGFLSAGNNSILTGVAGPLGNASSAIILGNAATSASVTSPTSGLDISANSVAGNYTISRNIDSSTHADVAGRTDVRFNNSAANPTGTLTVSSNWALAVTANRGFGLVVEKKTNTMDFTGAITGGGTAAFRINDNGNGNGIIRLSNTGNTYAGTTNVSSGTLLIAGNAAAASGVLGTNATLNAGEGGNGNGVVSALTDGAFTVGKTINLPNGSASMVATALGGNQAAVSSYTGNINTTANSTSRSLTLTQVAGGTVSFSGNIGANTDAAGTTSVRKVGAGTVALSGVNVYDGSTVVDGGTLLVNNVTGSGTGAGAVTVGFIGQAASGLSYTTGNNLSLAISGVSNATAATFTVGQAVSGTNIPAGAILTGIAFGPSTAVLSIDRGIATTTAAGTDLALTALTTTGTLGGIGIIGGIAGATTPVTVNAGSSIAPGDPSVAGGIGTLTIGSATVSRNTVFGDGSTFSIQVAGATSDKLAMFGNLDLSSLTDNLAITGTLDGINNYQIATYTGSLTGTFNTVTGNGFYTVDYGVTTPGTILLVVPEPSTYALILGGAGLLFFIQRRRRSA